MAGGSPKSSPASAGGGSPESGDYPDMLSAVQGLGLTVLYDLVKPGGLGAITAAVTNGSTAATLFAPTDTVSWGSEASKI